MKRRLYWGLGLAALAAFVVWLSANTEWTDATMPMPPRGEAATNPLYAVERLVSRLGARPVRAAGFPELPPDAVVVLSSWYWNLSPRRAEAVKRWVERGGRLVVDDDLYGAYPDFANWAGVTYKELEDEDDEDPGDDDEDGDGGDAPAKEPDRCGPVVEMRNGRATGTAPHRICDVWVEPFQTARPPVWSLGNDAGLQVVRMAIGRGSVTAINARPFTWRSLFDGDHGWLFVHATQLTRGDAVYFLSEDTYPSLLTLAWRTGAPIVVLGLAGIAAALWRRSDRHGPPEPAEAAPRRSLAEQIRGTGRFLARRDAGALHEAAVRALDEIAGRRIAGYAALSRRARVAAVARAVDLPEEALAHALSPPALGRPRGLPSSLATLEDARRRLAAQ